MERKPDSTLLSGLTLALYCPLHQVSHVRQFIKNVALVILEHIIPTFGSFAETPHEETMYSEIEYYFTFEFTAEGGQKVIAFL